MVCVGGATVDRRFRLAGPLRLGTSNPATGARGFGGVARNVAENLCRLGVPVALLSRVGRDEAGLALAEALDRLGVDRHGVEAVPGAATAEYLAVTAPDGDLALGLADMAVLDGLDPAFLERHASAFATADWVFADCNLGAPALDDLRRRLVRGGSHRLAVDAVSVAKAARLPDRLDGIDLLVLNRDEAAALARRRGDGDDAPAAVAEALLRAGAGAVVVTLGPEGALAASADGLVAVPAVPTRVVDVTGAGDALVAAVIRALRAGGTLGDALRLGCRAAAHTAGSVAAVSPDLASALDDPSM